MPQEVAKTRTIGQSILDVDKKEGIVDVLWSRFGNEDADGDVIEPGAYAKTIQEQGPSGSNRIKVMWNHQHLIGRPVTLEESKQHNGLVVRQKITPTSGTYGGRNALLLYYDEVITEHSVRISSIRRKGEDMPDYRHIVEVRLWEGGPQIWGANPLTPTLAAKSAVSVLQLQFLGDQVARAQKALQSGITDELAEEVELWLSDVAFGFNEMLQLLKTDAPIVIGDDFIPGPVTKDHPSDTPQESDLILEIAKRLRC